MNAWSPYYPDVPWISLFVNCRPSPARRCFLAETTATRPPPSREDISSQQLQLGLPPSREDISSQKQPQLDLLLQKQLQLDLPLREKIFPRNSCNSASPLRETFFSCKNTETTATRPPPSRDILSSQQLQLALPSQPLLKRYRVPKSYATAVSGVINPSRDPMKHEETETETGT